MRFTPPDGVLNLAQTLDCGQSFRFYPVTLENNIPAWRGIHTASFPQRFPFKLWKTLWKVLKTRFRCSFYFPQLFTM